jgi:hypothetical protein
MSDPSLFVSPLARQAARNLRTVEWLSGSGNDTWHTDWVCRGNFWRTWRTMAMTPDEAAAWLPALAFAVSCEKHPYVLAEFVQQPLPEPLPPEAIPWRDRLIRSWEQYCPPGAWEKTIRLFALVRLDRRLERLPEWLREAREALDLVWYQRHFRLAALASWRPRPGDGPPHGDKAEAAQAWVRFWEERYRTRRSELDALVVATARLHLAEAGWLPPGPSPERLRAEFRQWVKQWPVSPFEQSALRMLLASVPADASSPEQQDIRAWLELTDENVRWEEREPIWEMLAAWQREGILKRSGRGRLPEPPRLLPDLARALKWERTGEVLRAMAGYIPGAAEVSAHPEAARSVVARWEALSRNDDWQIRRAAWVARWNLRRAGVLTAEEQGRFGADYVDAIRSEKDWNVLLTLMQIRLPGTFPLATWAGRLSDQNDQRRLAAHLAIHDWLVEVMEGTSGEWEGRPAGRPYEWRVASGSEASGEWRVASGRSPLTTRCSPLTTRYSRLAARHPLFAITHRQMRQVLRRAGQEGAGKRPVAPFINLPPKVLPDFRRLREIETALAAGQMPPPPDAGKGKRKRMGHLATLARLPESHPRTGPPGITGQTTGRTAGSEPPARPPFPEVIRHE